MHDGRARMICEVPVGKGRQPLSCIGVGDNFKGAKVAAAKEALRQARRANLLN